MAFPSAPLDLVDLAPSVAPDRAPGASELVALATQLAACGPLWHPFATHDAEHRVHVRLAGLPTWEAWLITWPPGHGVEMHDHGGSAGAVAVVEGALVELTARPRALGAPRVARRALPTGTVRRIGRRRIHDVINVGPAPATSLHLYGPALSSMTFYDDDLRPTRTEVTYPEAPLLDDGTLLQGLAAGARQR